MSVTWTGMGAGSKASHGTEYDTGDAQATGLLVSRFENSGIQQRSDHAA